MSILKALVNLSRAGLMLLALLSAVDVFAQPEIFPLRSDESVKEEAQDTMSKRPQWENWYKIVGLRYRALGFGSQFPPHNWKCDNPKTEDIWRFDSQVMIHSSSSTGGRSIPIPPIGGGGAGSGGQDCPDGICGDGFSSGGGTNGGWFGGSGDGAGQDCPDGICEGGGYPGGYLSQPSPIFNSCFQAMPELDSQIFERLCSAATILKCIPIPKTPFSICNDPPLGCPACCPTDEKMLAKVGVHPPRNNRGYKITYWWPENEAEIQNYEVAAFNPTYECGNRAFTHEELAQNFLKNYTAATTGRTAQMAGIPASLREDPHLGQTHWYGEKPGEQVFHGEAHVYRTYLASLASMNNFGRAGWLGFKRDCSCFYGGGQEQDNDGKYRRVVNGWTEQPKYLPYWRNYKLSNDINSNKYAAIAGFSNPMTDMCASYRAFHSQWGKPIASGGMGYYDLFKSVGIDRPYALERELARICYKGGGDLFPITGQLIGPFSQLPATAYLARRAFYLFGLDRLKNGQNFGGEFVPDARRINKYSDKDDKMQRIFPLYGDALPSRCFRANEIPNYVQHGLPDWPKEATFDAAITDSRGGFKDGARYAYWNKREQCMCKYVGPIMCLKFNPLNYYMFCIQIRSACRRTDEGDREDSDTAPIEANNANKFPFPINRPTELIPTDGIPFPFIYEPGGEDKADYELDPIKGGDPAYRQSIGGAGKTCDLKRGPTKMHVVLPEDPAPFGYKCLGEPGRCAGQRGGTGGGAIPPPPPSSADCARIEGEERACADSKRRIFDSAAVLDPAGNPAIVQVVTSLPREPGAPGTLYFKPADPPSDPENPDPMEGDILCSHGDVDPAVVAQCSSDAPPSYGGGNSGSEGGGGSEEGGGTGQPPAEGGGGDEPPATAKSCDEYRELETPACVTALSAFHANPNRNFGSLPYGPSNGRAGSLYVANVIRGSDGNPTLGVFCNYSNNLAATGCSTLPGANYWCPPSSDTRTGCLLDSDGSVH